jgi:hypothetical protein
MERYGRSLVTEQVRSLLDEVRAGSHPELLTAAGFDREQLDRLLGTRLEAHAATPR